MCGNPSEVDAWWKAHDTDEGLLQLVLAVSGNAGDRQTAKPSYLEPFGDVEVMAERVRKMLAEGIVQDRYLPTAERFVYAYEQVKAGKKINRWGEFDGE